MQSSPRLRSVGFIRYLRCRSSTCTTSYVSISYSSLLTILAMYDLNVRCRPGGKRALTRGPGQFLGRRALLLAACAGRKGGRAELGRGGQQILRPRTSSLTLDYRYRPGDFLTAKHPRVSKVGGPRGSAKWARLWHMLGALCQSGGKERGHMPTSRSRTVA